MRAFIYYSALLFMVAANLAATGYTAYVQYKSDLKSKELQESMGHAQKALNKVLSNSFPTEQHYKVWRRREAGVPVYAPWYDDPTLPQPER